MPVLIEAISVVIRGDRLCDVYPGGWNAFKNDVPNATMCSDTELVRVGFMVPQDVGDFIEHLNDFGLIYLENGMARDMVVIDQIRGLMAPCEWAEFAFGGYDDDPNKQVGGCSLKGGKEIDLFTPEGWVYEGSLSQSYVFTPDEHGEKSMTFLRHEDGLDVHRSGLTGEEQYSGRTIKR